MRFTNVTFLLPIAPLLALGCAHSAKLVSFKFVELQAAPAATVDSDKYKIERGDTVFVDAKPNEPLTVPHYPTGLPKPSADSVTITVRIVVGAGGSVEDIQRSFADLSIPTPFSQACFESVKTAVVQWKFEPAQIAVVKPQANGRPLIVSSTPTDRPFEIAFTFSSSGRVAPDWSRR